MPTVILLSMAAAPPVFAQTQDAVRRFVPLAYQQAYEARKRPVGNPAPVYAHNNTLNELMPAAGEAEIKPLIPLPPAMEPAPAEPQAKAGPVPEVPSVTPPAPPASQPVAAPAPLPVPAAKPPALTPPAPAPVAPPVPVALAPQPAAPAVVAPAMPALAPPAPVASAPTPPVSAETVASQPVPPSGISEPPATPAEVAAKPAEAVVIPPPAAAPAAAPLPAAPEKAAPPAVETPTPPAVEKPIERKKAKAPHRKKPQPRPQPVAVPAGFHDTPVYIPAIGGDAADNFVMPNVPPAEPSEPPPSLSAQSRNVLENTPARIGTAHSAQAKNIRIQRSADMEDGSYTPKAIAKHEAMGIQIEVKTPRIDTHYELEKAYNATVSGQSSEAMDIYRTILAAEPQNPTALFGLASLYQRAGQNDKARPLYAEVLRQNPTNRDALNNFMAIAADEAPQDALNELEQLQMRNPDFSPIPAQMSRIYQKMGDLPAATNKMIEALQLAPENLAYRHNLAVLLDMQGNGEDAAKLYRQLVEAYLRGETIPGNIEKIQQRLTFLLSNGS